MEIRRTCLADVHGALGAQMAPFGGFEMPIRYEGIVAEHQACREGAALFDTCHMGEFILGGEGVLEDLERLVSCPVASMENGQCRYGFLCNPEGGVIDDLLLYRLADHQFMMVVNAGTQDGDAQWIRDHIGAQTTFENRSADTAKIDLQGPDAPRIVRALFGEVLNGLTYYRFVQTVYCGAPVLLSRTGYTGEIGVELYAAPDQAIVFWNAAMELGARPAGLGARDTLRLEAGFPLYGHELGPDRNAGASGFTRAIARDKSFIGSSAICEGGSCREQLVGIRLDGRRAARAGDDICDASGQSIGVVTSGSFGPSVGVAIAMGYVTGAHAESGTRVTVCGGRSELSGFIAGFPFWDRGTARMRIDRFLNGG